MPSVAVLVELERGPRAGGHVKCWERLAHAAAETALDLRLDLVVLGRGRRVERLSENVRILTLPPVVGSGPLVSLVGGVDRTDIAPYHPGLARLLPRYDVWHLTHTFAFAATALHLRSRAPRPLVASVHTDVPSLTRTYTASLLAKVPGGGMLAPLDLPGRAAAAATRRRDRILAACERVLVTTPQDRADVTRSLPAARVGRLRRGIDNHLFRPDRGDRQRLEREFGVPGSAPLLLFAGRVDATKGVLLVAEATGRLRRAGQPVHLVVAGDGADAPAVRRVLGDGVTLLGKVAQRELGWIMASCDALAFPSRSETAGNVVVEAMSCGLPVVLPAGARTEHWLTQPGRDGVLVEGDSPEAWANALADLLVDSEGRRRMGAAARRTAVCEHPSWQEVLEQDLLPTWLAVLEQPAVGALSTR